MKPRQLNDNDRSVLGALGDSSKPLSAYDILDRARSDALKAPVQVYRALQKLESQGPRAPDRGAERLRRLLRLRIAHEHEPRHAEHRPGFVICRDCGACASSRTSASRQVAGGGGRRGLRRRSRVARGLRPLRRACRDGGVTCGGARRSDGACDRRAAVLRPGAHRVNHEPHLAFDDLTLGYDRHPAVHHLDGAVEAGSLTAVVGPNGSGKSTLLKGIVGMLKPLGGRIVRSEPASGDIAYLPQQLGDRPLVSRPRVVDLVALGLWRRRGMLGRHHARRPRRRSTGRSPRSGLAGFQTRGIDTLSGGQLQRALFARVLLQDAPLILLDEPFNAIDHAHASRDLIAHHPPLARRGAHRDRRCCTTSTWCASIFRSTLLLARRPVAWGETREALRPENLLLARRLNESWDERRALVRAERARHEPLRRS